MELIQVFPIFLQALVLLLSCYSRNTLGTLNSIFSTAVSTVFCVTLKRFDIADITSLINISGADAPAVMPIDLIPCNARQSISDAL